MTIFNSLGSNYSWSFVRRALFTKNKDIYKNHLKEFLERKYRGKTYLVYKGREALELALKIAELSNGSKVGITGFTCYAVWKAVRDAGYDVVYLDIDESLNFPVDKISADLKVVIVQNTLGLTCDIEKISKFCRDNNIVLIEDLAHCVGAIYSSGKEVGTVGDFTVLSFSQDKMIDTVSGGALIIKNKKFQKKSVEITKQLSFRQQFQDRSYPLLTHMVRKTYRIGLGKILHYIFRTLHILSSPMKDSAQPTSLPNWYCYLVKHSFDKLDANLKHRRKISAIYIKNINQKLLFSENLRMFQHSGNLRFPIFTKKREELISYLLRFGIHISDIWYDSPIGPKKYLPLTDYKIGACPTAEKISEQIINLPTHRNVSEKQALYISQKINEWWKQKK